MRRRHEQRLIRNNVVLRGADARDARSREDVRIGIKHTYRQTLILFRRYIRDHEIAFLVRLRGVDLTAATVEKTAERLTQLRFNILDRRPVVQNFSLHIARAGRRLHLLDTLDRRRAFISARCATLLFATAEREHRHQADQSNYELIEHRKKVPFVLVLAAGLYHYENHNDPFPASSANQR